MTWTFLFQLFSTLSFLSLSDSLSFSLFKLNETFLIQSSVFEMSKHDSSQRSGKQNLLSFFHSFFSLFLCLYFSSILREIKWKKKYIRKEFAYNFSSIENFFHWKAIKETKFRLFFWFLFRFLQMFLFQCESTFKYECGKEWI